MCKGPAVKGGVDSDSRSLPRSTPTPGITHLASEPNWRAEGHWEGEIEYGLVTLLGHCQEGAPSQKNISQHILSTCHGPASVPPTLSCRQSREVRTSISAVSLMRKPAQRGEELAQVLKGKIDGARTLTRVSFQRQIFQPPDGTDFLTIFSWQSPTCLPGPQ